MKRILFVDDEPNILDGLKRILRPQRKEWEMVFANGGEQALAAGEENPFDVIVTDMRMPGIDGAELLTRYHELHPQTVRFVLSGQAELESVMRLVPIAHQFLIKPANRDTLSGAVNRAIELQDLLSDERAQRLIGEMDSLPSRPQTYDAVTQALACPDIEIAAVAAIIEADIAMSAKLLQLVNSAFFGLPQAITDVCHAATYLGLNMLRDLVLSVEVFRCPAEAGPELEGFLEQLQFRSTWTGSIARRMFDDTRLGNQAFTAGMLHDIGMLVMATQLPDQYGRIVASCRETKRPFQVVEEEVLGVTHAEVGAYLLGVWGLPYPILEAAAYHHRPSDLCQECISELTAVHVASALVESRKQATGPVSPSPEVDLSYLERLGVGDRLEKWQALVEEDEIESGKETRA
ncbi:MAG: HDOD domain-containing protein [Planctomycetota bacterium]